MSQTSGSTLTEYLIDQQPSLAVVLRQKIGSQNTHYIHGLRGIQSQVANSAWTEAMSDGLGLVRGWIDGSQNFVSSANYNPYGVPNGTVDDFGFTGEMTDDNGLVYLRARYYDPNVGVFASLDPFEGVDSRPMSVNGYSWVEGNVANWTDASGRCVDSFTFSQIWRSQDKTYDECVELNLSMASSLPGISEMSMFMPMECTRSVGEINAYNSTVTINMFSANGNARNVSLGTIASYNGQQALVTHDHFDANNTNVCQSLAYLQTFDYILIQGASGNEFIPTHDLQSTCTNQRGINIFLRNSRLPFIIGSIEAQIEFESQQPSNSWVVYPHIPGWNGDSWFSNSTTINNSNQTGYVQPFSLIKISSGNLTQTSPKFRLRLAEGSKGDSGAGLFNTNGNLIGVFEIGNPILNTIEPESWINGRLLNIYTLLGYSIQDALPRLPYRFNDFAKIPR